MKESRIMSLDFYKDYSNWTDELFGVKKPIIAMCHLQPTQKILIFNGESDWTRMFSLIRLLSCFLNII